MHLITQDQWLRVDLSLPVFYNTTQQVITFRSGESQKKFLVAPPGHLIQMNVSRVFNTSYGSPLISISDREELEVYFTCIDHKGGVDYYLVDDNLSHTDFSDDRMLILLRKEFIEITIPTS